MFHSRLHGRRLFLEVLRVVLLLLGFVLTSPVCVTTIGCCAVLFTSSPTPNKRDAKPAYANAFAVVYRLVSV